MKHEGGIVKRRIRCLLIFALVLCGHAVQWADAQQPQDRDASASRSTEVAKWNTVGLKQANTMGGGTGQDGVHFTAAGYVTLGKFTAAAVEEHYKDR